MEEKATKKIKFKCTRKECGHELVNEYAKNFIVPSTIQCPECKHITMQQHIPSYFERMKK